MNTEILEDLGLTQSEIKTYLTLLELGSSTAGPILEKSNLQNSVVSSNINIPEKDKRFPKKDTIRSVISMSINKHESIEDILEKEYPHLAEYSDYIKAETIGKKAIFC